MTIPTLTHYWPHDGDEQKAVCGAPMRDDAPRHSTTPSCPYCQAWLVLDEETAYAEAVARIRTRKGAA